MLPNPGRNENMECAWQSRRRRLPPKKGWRFCHCCASIGRLYFQHPLNEVPMRIRGNLPKKVNSSIIFPIEKTEVKNKKHRNWKPWWSQAIWPNRTRLSAKVIGTPMECIKPTCRLSSSRKQRQRPSFFGDVQIEDLKITRSLGQKVFKFKV